MSICHEKKLIFIHIPKNAGTSVQTFFNAQIDNIITDKTWDFYKLKFENYWDNYKKFSIVRNPFSRFISIYQFSRGYGDWIYDEMKCSLTKESTINDFANFVFEKYPNTGTTITIPQYKFICDKNDNISIDEIIKIENIEEIKKLGISNLKKLNKSKKLPEKFIQMNERTISIIKEIYNKDFEIFSY